MKKRNGSALLEAIIALALLVVLMPIIFNFILTPMHQGISDGRNSVELRNNVLHRHLTDEISTNHLSDHVLEYSSSTAKVRILRPRGDVLAQCNIRPNARPSDIVPMQNLQGFGLSNPITDIRTTADEQLLTALDGNQAASFDITTHIWRANQYIFSWGLNTGPGLRRLATDGKRGDIYAAQTSSVYQLQLLSLHREALEFVKNIQISTTTNTIGQAVAIDATRNLLALGMTKNSGPELYILDIASRTAPVVRDSFELNTQINDLAFRDGWLYVATPERPQVHRLRINSFGIIGEYQSISFSGDLVQDASRLIFVGDSLWVTRTVGGFNVVANPEIVRLKIDDPAGMFILEQFDMVASVNGFGYFDSLLFVALGEPRKIFTIQSGSLRQDHTYSGVVPAAFACDGEHILVGVNSPSGSASSVWSYSFAAPYVP